MAMFTPPWEPDEEPNVDNLKWYADSLYGKFETINQARWSEANIDTNFYAGEQRFINSYFNFNPTYSFQNFHFNLIQQPVNMVTGYQRQHRKSYGFIPIEGSKQDFADELSNVMQYANSYRGRLEKFSQAAEQSAIAGMVLLQPYLDFTDDPVNGTLDLKLWSYNSFMVDPFFREPDMSDCNFVWCQQYTTKREAIQCFPEYENVIRTMSGFGNKYGKFYFLPENYNLARNDLLVMSYIWFKSKRKKTMLYNRQDGGMYDYCGDSKHLSEMLSHLPVFEAVEVEVPTWKQAVMLNDYPMYVGENPLHFDECPFIPVFWNYDPHMAQYGLRTRSLVRSMRDTQFLFNRRVIINHDISESSINSGWKRKENSISNEEDLRYSGQGKDIIIKEGYELSDVEKIIPNAVPSSDMQLADQLADLVFRVSGVNQELMGMAPDSKTGIQEMLRQGAGLITLQKYFDQWDYALKLLGKVDQKIIQYNWSASKISRIIGKEANAEFQTKIFSRYDVLVEETLNTTIQKQNEFAQILELNQQLGGIIPPRFILEKSTLQGKNDIIKAIDAQQQQQAEMQKQGQLIEQAKLQSELQLLQARSVAEVALARERHGRAESNIGLFEERLSEITQNRSMALKNKVEALKTLLETYDMHGQMEAAQAANNLQGMNYFQKEEEDDEKVDAKLTSESNQFLTKVLQNNSFNNTMETPSQESRSNLL